MATADQSPRQAKLLAIRRALRWAAKNRDNYRAQPPSERAESLRILARKQSVEFSKLCRVIELLVNGQNADGLIADLEMGLVQWRLILDRRPGRDGADLAGSQCNSAIKKVAIVSQKVGRN
jgi:hypothetical protein